MQYPVTALLLRGGGPYPLPKQCGECGERMLWMCQGQECPDPIFHPDDLDARFHRLCGTPIPWYEAMRARKQSSTGMRARVEVEAPVPALPGGANKKVGIEIRLLRFLTDPVYRGVQSGIEKSVMSVMLLSIAAGIALVIATLKAWLHI